MTVYCLQHVPFEGPGAIADWFCQKDTPLIPVPLYAGAPLPEPASVSGLVVMGGPMGVGDTASYPFLLPEKRFLEGVFRQNVPVLGICLGAQLIAEVLGAEVRQGDHREIGWFPVDWKGKRFFAPGSFMAFHWHGDTFGIPEGATLLASSAACAHQAFVYREHIVGLQFHLEMTQKGAATLVAECAAELGEGGRFVQTKGEILEASDLFSGTKPQLFSLLSELFMV